MSLRSFVPEVIRASNILEERLKVILSILFIPLLLGTYVVKADAADVVPGDNPDENVIEFNEIESPATLHLSDESYAISKKSKTEHDGEMIAKADYQAAVSSDTLGEGDNQTLAAADNTEEAPNNFRLKQNYPNPFNPATEISYKLPVNEHVVLKVYDMLGRPIKTLVNKEQEAGSYTVRFNAGGLTSGMYLYRLKAGNYEQIRKMILIK